MHTQSLLSQACVYMYINKRIEEVLKWSTKQRAISNTQELQKDESLIFFFQAQTVCQNCFILWHVALVADGRSLTHYILFPPFVSSHLECVSSDSVGHSKGMLCDSTIHVYCIVEILHGVKTLHNTSQGHANLAYKNLVYLNVKFWQVISYKYVYIYKL